MTEQAYDRLRTKSFQELFGAEIGLFAQLGSLGPDADFRSAARALSLGGSHIIVGPASSPLWKGLAEDAHGFLLFGFTVVVADDDGDATRALVDSLAPLLKEHGLPDVLDCRSVAATAAVH